MNVCVVCGCDVWMSDVCVCGDDWCDVLWCDVCGMWCDWMVVDFEL